MTSPRKVAEEIVASVEVVRFDETAYLTVEDLKNKIEQALIRYGEEKREEAVRECVYIVNEELGDESELDDDCPGNLKSMHIGAMEVLSTVHEKILSLLLPRRG